MTSCAMPVKKLRFASDIKRDLALNIDTWKMDCQMEYQIKNKISFANAAALMVTAQMRLAAKSLASFISIADIFCLTLIL
jgi:hypothetical protein